MIFQSIAVVFAFGALGVTIALKSGARTRLATPSALARAQPPEIDPLSAAMLLGRRKRALGAGVLDLVARGYATARVESTVYYLTLVAEPPLAQAQLHALVAALFPGRHALGDRVAVNRGRDQGVRLGAVLSGAVRALRRHGILPGGGLDTTLGAANVVSAVSIGAVLAGGTPGSVALAILLVMVNIANLVVRRSGPPLRTARGSELVEHLRQYRLHLVLTPVQPSEFGWRYLFDLRSGTTVASNDRRGAGDAGGASAVAFDDEHNGYDPFELGTEVDSGSGGSGDGGSGGSGDGGDGGGGGD